MENLNNSWKIEKVVFFKTLTKITKAISNIPSGKSIMQLVYSVSLWGKNVAFSSISKNGISSVLRQTGESQNGCFKKTKQVSVKECYMSKRETKKWTIYVAFLAAFYSLRWLWLHCCSSIFTIDLNWCVLLHWYDNNYLGQYSFWKILARGWYYPFTILTIKHMPPLAFPSRAMAFWVS